ncbi:MAG: hypothetical protein GYA60_07035 [Candidatus Methanofastidiosa archaeon]|nr:hypothetical protein [Candidatus Methanofastidiosa archaeon]
MTETQKAYLAGIIDGEGCIGIFAGKSNGSASLIVRIGMCSYETISTIAKWIGCPVLKEKKRREYQQLWLIQLTFQQAEDVLKAVLPYLITKKEQAQLALDFREFQKSIPKYNRSEQQLTTLHNFICKSKLLHNPT